MDARTHMTHECAVYSRDASVVYIQRDRNVEYKDGGCKGGTRRVARGARGAHDPGESIPLLPQREPSDAQKLV